MTVAWEDILQGATTKAIDLAYLRQTMKAIPPAPAQAGAVPAPGLDGQPIRSQIDGRWLIGGALLIAGLLIYKAVK